MGNMRPGAQLSREIRVQCSMLAGITHALDACCHFLLARWARASPSKVSLADAQDLDSRRLVSRHQWDNSALCHALPIATRSGPANSPCGADHFDRRSNDVRAKRG
jgi:hypothetical protein